jgi:hypothetical protein
MMNAVMMFAMLAGAAARPVPLQQPALRELRFYDLGEQTTLDVVGQERKLLHNHAPSGSLNINADTRNSGNTYISSTESNGSGNTIDKSQTVGGVGHGAQASGGNAGEHGNGGGNANAGGDGKNGGGATTVSPDM